MDDGEKYSRYSQGLQARSWRPVRGSGFISVDLLLRSQDEDRLMSSVVINSQI